MSLFTSCDSCNAEEFMHNVGVAQARHQGIMGVYLDIFIQFTGCCTGHRSVANAYPEPSYSSLLLILLLPLMLSVPAMPGTRI